MSGKQGEFDWPRARQLAALRNCRLPDVVAKDGITVRFGVLRSVLLTIDQFAGKERECFASLPTLSATTGFSLRHVKRAIAALQVLSVITCERHKNRYGVVTNHYRIVWSELELLVPANGYQSALEADQSALESKPKCLGGTQSGMKRKEALREDMDHVFSCFVEDITGLTARAFLAAGYLGNEGGNFWKAAALLHLGLISEHEIWDACAATKAATADKPRYFYRCLANAVAQRGGDLSAMLAQVRILPVWPTSPPVEVEERRSRVASG